MKNYESWENFDFVFANATCFERETTEKLARLMNEGKVLKEVGSILLISTQKLELDTEQFETVGPIKKCMSWGRASLFVHRRIK